MLGYRGNTPWKDDKERIPGMVSPWMRWMSEAGDDRHMVCLP